MSFDGCFIALVLPHERVFDPVYDCALYATEDGVGVTRKFVVYKKELWRFHQALSISGRLGRKGGSKRHELSPDSRG